MTDLDYSPTVLGSCRVCGDAAYTADGDGPVHSCCRLHGDPCPACASARTARQTEERRGRR